LLQEAENALSDRKSENSCIGGVAVFTLGGE